MEGNVFEKYKQLLKQNTDEKDIVLGILQEIFPHKKWLNNSLELKKHKTVAIRLSSSEKTMFILRGGLEKCKEKGYTIFFM